MAATKFAPVTIELIDEGAFKKAMDEELKAITQYLIGYKKKHGISATTGVKAQLDIKLVVCFDGREETDFSIKGTITRKVPARPASVTVGIEGEEQDGQSTLFVRHTGSTKDSPRQGILHTREGDIVDPVTGEIADDKPKDKSKDKPA